MPPAVPLWRPAQLPGGVPHPPQWQRTVQHLCGPERDWCVEQHRGLNAVLPLVQALLLCRPGYLPLKLPWALAAPFPAPLAVLADSGEVFSSLPEALPTFDQWLNFSAGVNINKTIEVGAGPVAERFVLLPTRPRRRHGAA